jgi:hypothetical protein
MRLLRSFLHRNCDYVGEILVVINSRLVQTGASFRCGLLPRKVLHHTGGVWSFKFILCGRWDYLINKLEAELLLVEDLLLSLNQISQLFLA